MSESTIENIKSLYGNTDTNVLCCDNSLNIIWINSLAEQNFSKFHVGDSVANLFRITNFEDILNKISRKESFNISILFEGHTNYSLFANPIIFNQTVEFYLLFIYEQQPLSFSSIMKTKSNNEIERILTALAGQYRSPLFCVFNMLTPISHALEVYEQYDTLEYVKHISKSCYKMIKTTVNNTEYQRLSNNAYKFNFRRVNLNLYLSDLCKSIQILLRSSKITLNYDITDDIIISLIDTDSLSLALMNIISNSCLFSNLEPQINISLYKQNNDFIISVSDNGVGIAPQHLDYVFDPYFSYDPNGNPFAGSGVGLCIVKHVITAHKGSYVLSSAINKGTTIVLKIPIIDNEESAKLLESNSANYIANKFSPLYIFLSDFTDISVF
ncbi:MAG: hypothetical protein K0R90_235 [Oscillospiraceae bacterium]|jgi:signal transduction histidine kinase|nr:hypothetical protein [Oscillospiraceae bacterium]